MKVEKIEKLTNLNNIATLGNLDSKIESYRFYKTISKSKKDDKVSIDYYRSCLEKISFCIQDLNYELELIDKGEFNRKDITYINLCVTWIKESFWNVKKDLNKNISEKISQDLNLERYKKFIDALRSFSVAHPMSTTEHEKYKFDGTLVNVDIGKIKGNKCISLFFDSQKSYHLSPDGLIEVESIKKDDFYFRGYNKVGDGAMFSKHIGCSFKDIYAVAQAYIDRLYEIDKLIRRLARNKEI